MIRIPEFADRAVAVMGLGVAGLATVRALVASGADVRAWDDSEAQQEMARAEGATIADLVEMDWTGIDTLVPEPRHPALLSGAPSGPPSRRNSQAPRSSAMWTCSAGRSRAQPMSALPAPTAKARPRRWSRISWKPPAGASRWAATWAQPVLGLEPLDEDGVYVLEMSSYQLERTFSIGFGRGAADEHQRGPPGPPQRDGRLYRRQGTYLRPAGRGLHRHRLRRRHLLQGRAQTPSPGQRRGDRHRHGGCAGGQPDRHLPRPARGCDRRRAGRGHGPRRHSDPARPPQRPECGGGLWPSAARSACLRRSSPTGSRPSQVCPTGRNWSQATARVLYVNDSKATNQDAAARAARQLRAHLLDRRRPGQGRRLRNSCARTCPGSCTPI